MDVRQPRRKAKKRKESAAESESQWILEKPKSYSKNDDQTTTTLQTRQPRRKTRQRRQTDSPLLENRPLEHDMNNPININGHTSTDEPLEVELPVKTQPSRPEKTPEATPKALLVLEIPPDAPTNTTRTGIEDVDAISNELSPILTPKTPTLSVKLQPTTVEQQQKNKPHVSGPHSTRILPSKKPMPSDEILNVLFTKLLDRLNLAPEKIAEMNMMSSEQKWTLILAQDEMSSGLSCMYYVEQLVRHTQPDLKEKRVKRSLLEKLHPLTKVLKGLEIELRTNQESWVNEFVASPCHGHIALIDLLKDLIEYPGLLNSIQKYPVIQRSPALVHTALICVRVIMSNRHGFNAVINYVPSVYTITHCIGFPHNKTKGLILKLLTSVLLVPGGPQKVLQAFDHYHRVKEEHKKFSTLVNSMFRKPIDSDYQAEVLRFINTVIQTADGRNAKVFHQQEFINAGFDIKELEQLYSESNERITHEIKEWNKEYTNIQQIVDELMITKGRVRGLKQELDMTLKALREARIERDNYYEYSVKAQKRNEKLFSKVKSMNNEISQLADGQQERNNMIKRINQLQEINERYRQHTTELRNKIGEFVEEKELEGLEIDPSIDLQEQIIILQKYKMTTSSTQTTESMTNLTEEYLSSLQESKKPDDENESETVNIPEAPPIPLPPPLPGTGPIPPPPPLEVNGSIRKPHITNLPLPTLNWIPLRNSEHTIFDGMNDEAVIEEVDFTEFETLFQVPQFKTKELKAKEKAEKRVELLDQKRARGIVFAKRRIKQEAETIAALVENIDLDGLVFEHCELLLQIVPNESEREILVKNAKDYDKFGEAEQFLYQLAKIERLEERLGVMSFIGNFDELLLQTQPKVDAVLNASLSIFRSSRLKKVFEIVLAFGNYMNSSKRGTVTGFKLASLQRILDTKSTDKKLHLLHYIVSLVEKQYPNVLGFYEDLKVDRACEVSLEMVEADINNLKSGLKALQDEHELNPKNFILFSFSKHVTRKVEKVLEHYQKMKDAYTEVCLMFSESSKEEPENFFGYFRSFITSWKAAMKDNKKRSIKQSTSSGKNLQKKQQTPQKIMKDIASEAALVASSRLKKMREETIKLDQEGKVEIDGVKVLHEPSNTDKETFHKPQTSKEDSKKSSTKTKEHVENNLFDDEYYSSMMNDT